MTQLVYTDRQPADQSMHTGNVYATHVLLRFWGDGTWWFSAQLDDTSVLVGDNYAIGFSFEEGGFAGVRSGLLGSDETSVPQHARFAIQGRNEGLQRNYYQLAATKMKFRLHISTDPGQVFDDIGEDLKWLGKHIELMFSIEADSDQGDPPDSIDHPSDDG